MISSQDWVLTWEDLLLAFSIFLLWIEIIKSTRMGMRSIMDHILAMALFVAMLVEFLLVRQAGTSTFFLLMVIALVDVLAGIHRQHPQLAAPARNRIRPGRVRRRGAAGDILQVEGRAVAGGFNRA